MPTGTVRRGLARLGAFTVSGANFAKTNPFRAPQTHQVWMRKAAPG
jgi:hypothetical protein